MTENPYKSKYNSIKEKNYYMINVIFGDFINEEISFTKDDIFYGTTRECINFFSDKLKSKLYGSAYQFDNKKVKKSLKHNLSYKNKCIHHDCELSPTFRIKDCKQDEDTNNNKEFEFIIMTIYDSFMEDGKSYSFKYFTFLIDEKYLEKVSIRPPTSFIDPKKIKKESKQLMSHIIYRNIKNKKYYMPTNIGYAEEDLNVTFNKHNLFYGTVEGCLSHFIDKIESNCLSGVSNTKQIGCKKRNIIQ
jgi:hypothetical protein